MKNIAGLLALTVSAFALTACFDSSSKNGSTPIVVTPPPGATYKAVPIQGSYEDNTAHAVFSTDLGEGPIDTRFTVQFTADEKVVIVDNGLAKTYTFTADQVQGGSFHLMEDIALYATQLDNRGDLGPMPDSSDTVAYNAYWDAMEAVYVLTPTATNDNEYALARVSSVDGQQWMLIGDPTSTVLAGNASFSGGYYIAGPGGGAIGDMDMTADFNGAADAIAITMHNPEYDATNALFGAPSISFSADFNSGANTITGSGKAVTGGHHDTAEIHGGFFDGGNAAAGMLRLEQAGVPASELHGAFHVLKN